MFFFFEDINFMMFMSENIFEDLYFSWDDDSDVMGYFLCDGKNLYQVPVKQWFDIRFPIKMCNLPGYRTE